jgi:hypothetical protein
MTVPNPLLEAPGDDLARGDAFHGRRQPGQLSDLGQRATGTDLELGRL